MALNSRKGPVAERLFEFDIFTAHIRDPPFSHDAPEVADLPSLLQFLQAMSAKPDARTAEFARLLQFFDQLASRGSGGKKRSNDSHTVAPLPPLPDLRDVSSTSNVTSKPAAPSPSDEDPIIIPSDITPVVANLANTHHRSSKLKSYAGLGIGKLAKRRQTAPGSESGSASNSSSSSKSRTRSSSSSSRSGLRGASGSSTMTTSTVGSTDSEAGKASVAKFPLANNKQRPFTFRLMLHKLYATRDDWVQKVQEALEQSKKEYKSLAELVVEEEEGGGSDKSVHQKKGEDKNNWILNDSGINTNARRRCKSSVAASTYYHSTTTSSPGPALTESGSCNGPTNRPNSGFERARAVKKRCVGRRKSFDGRLSLNATVTDPFNAHQSGSGDQKLGSMSAWVYDAAVAQIESESESDSYWRAETQRRRRSVSVSTQPGEDDRAFGKRRIGVTREEETAIPRKVANSWGAGGALGAADENEKRFIRKRALTAIPSAMVQGSNTTRIGLKRPLESRQDNFRRAFD